MSLGYGIGDAIVVIKIAMQLYNNFISVAKDAKKEFGVFSRELKNLKSMLEGIKRECGPRGKLMGQSSSTDQKAIVEDLKEAVEITKEGIKCWNALLGDFSNRPQGIQWKVAWAKKFSKITQCRDRIYLQSRLLEIAILQVHTSQNSTIIKEITELKFTIRSLPPIHSLSDTEESLDVKDPIGNGSTEGSNSFTEDIYENGGCKSTFDVISIIQNIDDKIWRIRIHNKPIRCKLQIPENTPLEEFTKRFQESADTENLNEECLSESWLRLGTWWLVKSMKLYKLLGTSSIVQSYVDLLKASWILYSILGMNNIESPETQDTVKSFSPQDRTLLENLASGINYHTNNFKGKSILNDDSVTTANFSIWEPMAAEELETRNNYEPELDPRRWITVEKEHAGDEGENVLYRSFVQAQIGKRAMRLLVEDTDYMLCLVVPSEQTDPTIILSNQAGTMNLSCGCSAFLWTHHDLQNDTVRKIIIPFDRRPVPLTFKTPTDYNQFISIAQRHLKAVEDREPSEVENEIFRSIVQEYDEKNVNSGKSIQPLDSSYHENHCWEVRIHETISDNYWQTVRRLTISSCARAENPKCISFFLPPSKVYISQNTEIPSDVTLRWSDCSQKDPTHRTNGSFGKLYTYGFFPDTPNHEIKFSFLNEKDATNFSNINLCLDISLQPVSRTVLQSWVQKTSEYRLLRVSDLKRSLQNPKYYKALVVTRSKETSWTGNLSRGMELWRRSDICFFERDIDYIINDHEDNSTIDLIGVFYPLYLSNHRDQPRDVTTATPAKFLRTERSQISRITISLTSVRETEELQRQISPLSGGPRDTADLSSAASEVHGFINALADDWNIILSMRVPAIEFAQPSFILKKSKSIEVYLQVWNNSTSERLVARRIVATPEDPAEWISVKGATEKCFGDAARSRNDIDSNRMVIGKCKIWRGDRLNTAEMQAIGGKTFEVAEFTIRFKSNRQRDKFRDSFEQQSPGQSRNSSNTRNNTFLTARTRGSH